MLLERKVTMNIKKVGQTISYLRKQANYTQKDLADRLGVSDKAVSRWERGVGLPDISYLQKLAIILDTDTDSLLLGNVHQHEKVWKGLLILDENAEGIGLDTVIYDRPMACFLLGYFMLMGIKDILVICSEKEKNFMESQFAGGDAYGLHLVCCNSTLKSALQVNDSFTCCSNYMVVYGRSIIYGVDQSKFFQRAMAQKDRITILSLPRGMKPSRQKLCFNDDKRIIHSAEEETINTQYDYYGIPVMFCPQDAIYELCPERTVGVELHGEVLENKLYTEFLDRGFIELTIDTWDDVNSAAAFVKVTEYACGMKIYCLEEIAWRRGMITEDALKRFAEESKGTSKGKYLSDLCKLK